LIGVAGTARVRALEEVVQGLAKRANLRRIGRIGSNELALPVGAEEAFIAFHLAHLLVLLRGSGRRASGPAKHRARPCRQPA